MKTGKMTVAQYLTRQLARCDKSQAAVAQEAGYDNPNVVSMFKHGKTKLPYAAVGRLATAMKSDPAELFRLTVKEYNPELWEVIESTLAAQPVCTATEMEILQLVICVAKGRPIDLSIAESRRQIEAAVDAAAVTTAVRADASVAALERLPRNRRHSKPTSRS